MPLSEVAVNLLIVRFCAFLIPIREAEFENGGRFGGFQPDFPSISHLL
jgi:hypothetical protein